MKNSTTSKVVESALKFFAKNSANSTSSGIFFQPKVPARLKKTK